MERMSDPSAVERKHAEQSSVLLNKYSLVKVAARRARQLQSGAPPLGKPMSMKACRVAQDEIRAGQVGYVLGGEAARTALHGR